MKKVITNSIFKPVSKAISVFASLLLLLTVSAFAQNPCNAHFSYSADSLLNVQFNTSSNNTGVKYYWNFGDGTSSTNANPKHTYTTAKAYWVCLYVVDSGVCQDQWCDTVRVTGKKPPLCDARFQTLTGANPDSIKFYPMSNTGSNSRKYLWSFGDGGTSTNIFAWHYYANPGTYYVCLTVTDSTAAGKCSNTVCDSVKVNVKPKPVCDAHFQHYATNNRPDSVQFFSGTHTPSTRYSWNFGDGGFSHDPNPWHRYASGKYLACLTVTDSTSAGICTDTWCDSIVAGNSSAPCNAHFTFRFDSINATNGVRFFSNPNPPGTNYYWSFGDGTSATGPNPVHTYSQKGVYVVCLYINNTANPCQQSWCDTIYIQGGVVKPVCNAKFQRFALNSNPDSIHFYGSYGSNTSKYSWSFGDGTTGKGRDPWHFYPNHGTYYVCLTVTDSTAGGTCTDTWCDTIKVGPPPAPSCDARFKATWTSNTKSIVKFISNPNPAGTNYYWSFGDSTTSTDPHPYHTYSHTGTYVVCLTVSNTLVPCTQTWCDTIRIQGPPKPNCNAHFVRYALNNKQDSVHFYVTPPNASTAKYKWTFGDGTSSTNASPWHRYLNAGVYYVCLTVTDSTAAGKCSDTWCDSVRVKGPQAPVCDARFKFYANQQNPDSIHFYSGTTSSVNKKYTWSFGDGSGSHNPYPWHYYANPGIYYVCLTVTDSTSGGICTATWCDSIRVGAKRVPCNPHFTRLSTNGTNTTIKFIPAPNNPGTKFHWNFGDGSTSANMSPIHQYANPGMYWVCLTVKDSSNAGVCTATWCDSIRVGTTRPPCDARFKYQYAYYLNTLYFVHASNPPGTKYSWDFGDGTTSTIPNALHQYANAGTYWVCLTVIDSIGACRATWCDSVRVKGVSTRVCNSNYYFKPGNTLHSLNFFASPNPPSSKYFWDFGDGHSSTLPNPFHQYAVAGTYKVCLTVTDSLAGCSDTRCLTLGPLRMAQGGSTLEEQSNIVANVYPNPMSESGYLHIENTNGAVTFRMFDNLGRIAMTMSNLTNGEVEFNKQGLRPGLYLYEVIDADSNVTRGKLIIQ